jgi:hypothetical protein
MINDDVLIAANSQFQTLHFMMSCVKQGYTWEDFEATHTIDFIARISTSGPQERDELKEHYRLLWWYTKELCDTHLRVHCSAGHQEEIPVKKPDAPVAAHLSPFEKQAMIEDVKSRLSNLSFDLVTMNGYSNDSGILEDIKNDYPSLDLNTFQDLLHNVLYISAGENKVFIATCKCSDSKTTITVPLSLFSAQYIKMWCGWDKAPMKA